MSPIVTKDLKRTILSLETAITLYKSSVAKGEDVEIQRAFRDACIQRFEYCIEFCWKTSMKILGSQVVAAKPAIREMARSNLISQPELWIKFIETRNETSHAYDEDIAKRVFAQVDQFFPEAVSLLNTLGKMNP